MNHDRHVIVAKIVQYIIPELKRFSLEVDIIKVISGRLAAYAVGLFAEFCMEAINKKLEAFNRFVKNVTGALSGVFSLIHVVMKMIHWIKGILQLYHRTHRLVLVHGDVFVYEENSHA